MKIHYTLPDNPSFDYLKREARAIKSQHRNRDESIIQLIGHFDTSLHGMLAEEIFDRRFSILDAQRVLARKFGFASWTRMKKFVLHSAPEFTIADTTLRAEIIKRNDTVCSLIETIKKQNKGAAKTRNLHKLDAFGRDTTDFINPIYDQYGWPGPDIIGRDGTDACWWLVGHASFEGELQFRTAELQNCLLYTSPSPRDQRGSRMPSSA